MTRNEAFKLINDAISDNKAAAQISSALDAIGLLNLGRLAYQPGFHPPGQEPEDISRADPQPAYAQHNQQQPQPPSSVNEKINTRPTLPPDTPAGSYGIAPPVPGDPLGRADPAEAEHRERINREATQISAAPLTHDVADSDQVHQPPPNPSKRQQDWATFRERER